MGLTLATPLQAYRTGTKLKLGLIVAAVVIAAVSLLFTWRLADRLQAQDEAAVELWARAIEFQARVSFQGNPHAAELAALDSAVASGAFGADAARIEAMREALAWAESQPGGEGLDFVFSEIVQPRRFSVPAIITDSSLAIPTIARNVEVDSSGGIEATQEALLARAAEMDEGHPPIRFEYLPGQVQYVHYGESDLARLIRAFPAVQLAVVALFVLVGYLGFSYVRRSEQSMLWVGMAKEAAHQLGTPLSSMIGWVELLRLGRRGAHGDRSPTSWSKTSTASAASPTGSRRSARSRRCTRSLWRRSSTASATTCAGGCPAPARRRRWTSRRRPISAPGSTPSCSSGSSRTSSRTLWTRWRAAAAPSPSSRAARGHRPSSTSSDTGKGMDRATARHVFRPGFSTKRRGWGLGLSLSRRIVEAYHGGRLEVLSSRPGVGTTFRITLDAAAPEADAPEAAAPEAQPAGASGASRLELGAADVLQDALRRLLPRRDGRVDRRPPPPRHDVRVALAADVDGLGLGQARVHLWREAQQPLGRRLVQQDVVVREHDDRDALPPVVAVGRDVDARGEARGADAEKREPVQLGREEGKPELLQHERRRSVRIVGDLDGPELSGDLHRLAKQVVLGRLLAVDPEPHSHDAEDEQERAADPGPGEAAG